MLHFELGSLKLNVNKSQSYISLKTTMGGYDFWVTLLKPGFDIKKIPRRNLNNNTNEAWLGSNKFKQYTIID